jgi:hypothetical protein
VPFGGIPPVDAPGRRRQVAGVKKKALITKEAAAPYAAKKPAKGKAASGAQAAPAAAVRYASSSQVKKAADEVYKVHEALFRKLAQ